MNRSVSILSNLSEISESFVFGTTRWYPDEPKMNHDYSSDLREPMSKTSDPDIDDDWSDMPSYNPRSSSKASGSDVERERLERRRSISKLETLKLLIIYVALSSSSSSFSDPNASLADLRPTNPFIAFSLFNRVSPPFPMALVVRCPPPLVSP